MTRVWFKTLGISLGAAVALGAAGAASALTLGPAIDLLRVVSTADASPFHATAWAPPVPGLEQPYLRGQAQITLVPGAAPLPVIGIGYLSAVSGHLDSGSVVFTSIFGTSAAAIAAPYPGNGWVPLPEPGQGSSIGSEEPFCVSPPNPDVCRPFKGYELFGTSGTIYTAGPAVRLTLSQLPAALGGGFDLTPFAGSPAGVFYVFQVELPASELSLPVPEPGSALLLAGGLALLARRAWRLRAGMPAVAPAASC